MTHILQISNIFLLSVIYEFPRIIFAISKSMYRSLFTNRYDGEDIIFII